MKHKAKITNAALAGYGALALPLAFAGLPIYMYAPKFYTEHFGLSLTAIGVVLLVLRLIDAVQDPFIGYICDKFTKARNAFFSIGCLTLGSGVYLIFNPPLQPNVIWFLLAMFLTASGFSVVAIILGTIGITWSQDYHTKTRIAAFREGAILLGVLIASLLPFALEKTLSNFEALKTYAVITAVVSFSVIPLFFLWQKKSLRNVAEFHAVHKFKIQSLFSRAQYKIFFIGYLFNTLAASFPLVTFLFFVDDFLGLKDLAGIFLAVYFLAGVFGMPLWHVVSKRYGKKISWLISMVLSIVSFVWVFLLPEQSLVRFSLICVASGVALGADFSLPPSILSDIMDKEESANLSATQYSVQNFVSKSALAVASIIAFLGLEYISNEGGDLIKIVYAGPAIALKICAAIIVFFWIKNDGAVNENLKKVSNNSRSDHVL